MLSVISKLEIKISERTYQFFCGSDSPIGEVHDALAAMKSFVVEKIKAADEAKNPDVAEEPKTDI
jgi:hypothetical protein